MGCGCLELVCWSLLRCLGLGSPQCWCSSPCASMCDEGSSKQLRRMCVHPLYVGPCSPAAAPLTSLSCTHCAAVVLLHICTTSAASAPPVQGIAVSASLSCPRFDIQFYLVAILFIVHLCDSTPSAAASSCSACAGHCRVRLAVQQGCNLSCPCFSAFAHSHQNTTSSACAGHCRVGLAVQQGCEGAVHLPRRRLEPAIAVAHTAGKPWSNATPPSRFAG